MVNLAYQPGFRIQEKRDGSKDSGHGMETDRGTEGPQPQEGGYVGRSYVLLLRTLVVFTLMSLWIFQRHAQDAINMAYAVLLSSALFNSVYFETLFTTFCFAILIPVYPWLVDKFRVFDKYKIHESVHYVKQPLLGLLKEMIYYVTPLMILDTFMVKKYPDVDPSVWVEKRKDWIQVTRALPSDPPTVFGLIFQLFASIILYDVLFFGVHLLLHKNYFLYKYIHKHHHDHEIVHSHVTNQLTVVERITLILSANFSLKVFHSHPLTRTVFVPVFLFILIDNHAGYDLPFGTHRLIPFGLAGGSVKHFDHHVNGKRSYQPIFTYLDSLLAYLGKKKII